MTVTIFLFVLLFFRFFSYGFLVPFHFHFPFLPLFLGLKWVFFGAGLYKIGFCHGTVGVEFCSGVSFLHDTTLISHYFLYFSFGARLWGP